MAERRDFNAPIRLVELDSLRGLTALWVFAYHIWQFGGSPRVSVGPFDLFTPVHHGPAGVDLFMVLSGFCLFWPMAFAGKPDLKWSWQSYLLRRARRILPAYYGAIAYAVLIPIALVFAVRLFGGQANSQPVPSGWQIVSHVLLIHTLFKETWDGVTGAFWSMGLEAQFYLAFPILVWAWRRFGVSVICFAAIVSLLYRCALAILVPDVESTAHFLLSITFLGRWMQFAAGMAAAVWVAKVLRNEKRLHSSWWSLLIGMGLVVVVTALQPFASRMHLIPWRDVLLACGYALVVAGVCVAPARFAFFLRTGPLVQLGTVSYSFFLIHQPTGWYLMEFLRKKMGIAGVPQVLLGLSAGLIVTLLISGAFFTLLEHPFLRSRVHGEGGARELKATVGQVAS